MSKSIVSCVYKLYAIVDVRAKSIVGTFTSVNDASAERSFMNLLTEPRENLYNLNPGDFSVYHIADLGFDKGSVIIREPGIDLLIESGFDIGTLTVDKVVFEGSSISSERLVSLRKERIDRMNSIFSKKEVSDNEVSCSAE